MKALFFQAFEGTSPDALARDVDAGLAAEAELGQEVVHAVDPEVVGDVVEICVAGLRRSPCAC